MIDFTRHFNRAHARKVAMDSFRLLLAPGLTCLAAGCYLWLSKPVFGATAVIRIEEVQAAIPGLTTTAVPRSYVSRVVAEEPVIRSSRVIRKAVENSDWDISFFAKQCWRTIDLYPLKPAHITLFKPPAPLPGSDVKLVFNRTGTVHIYYTSPGRIISRDCRPGQPVKLPGLEFSVDRTKDTQTDRGYIVRFNSADDLVNRIAGGLSITEPAKFSSIADISLTDTSPVFAADALAAVLSAYIENDRRQKKVLAMQLTAMIDNELKLAAGKAEEANGDVAAYNKRAALSDPFRSAQRTDEYQINRSAGLMGKYSVYRQLSDILLEKRFEAGLAAASPLPIATVIEPPAANFQPLYPVKSMIWRSAVLLGILIDLISIYLLSGKRKSRIFGVHLTLFEPVSML